MSTKAYVLITTETPITQEAAQEVRRVSGVVELSEVMGPYDLIAVVEAEDIEGITDAIRQIRPVPGVRNTLTCVVIHSVK